MSTIIPRLSKTNTERALRDLALIKVLEDELKSLKQERRDYLQHKAMEPGDKKTVYSPNGREIATISRSKKTPGALKVVDAEAFIKWLEAHEPAMYKDMVKTVTILDPDKVYPNQLEAIYKRNGGEVPDGIGVGPVTGGTVSVRQTAKQVLNLLEEVQGLAGVAGLIEAGDDK